MSNSIGKEIECVVLAHENGNTLGVLRNLGEIGLKPELVLVCRNPEFIHKCRYIASLRMVDDSSEGLEYIISKYSRLPRKTFIFTDSDSIIALLDINRERLGENFYFFGSEKGLSKYMQKENLCKLAAQVGLKYPKTETVKVGELPKTLDYPIFTKSENSITIDNWKCNAFINNNEDELRRAYEKIIGDTVLLQEYIVKDNEYMLQGVSVNDGRDVYIPIQGRFYRLPDDSYGTYMHFEECTNQEIVEKIRKMLSFIGFNGVFEVEFLEDKKNEKYFLEINFRQTAWTHAFSDMGVNFHEIFIKSILGREMMIEGNVINKQPLKLISEFNDFSTYVMNGKMRLRDWVKDFWNANSCQIWNKKDPMPFFYVFWSKFMKKMST